MKRQTASSFVLFKTQFMRKHFDDAETKTHGHISTSVAVQDMTEVKSSDACNCTPNI